MRDTSLCSLRFVTVAAAVLAPAATPATPPEARLSTFAGEWIVHTRSLEITRFGRAIEHVN